MTLFALPMLFAIFAWWFSTGAILYLDGLSPRTFRWSLLGATILFGVSVYGLLVSGADLSASGAYVAFTGGLVIWAWLELTYYMGFVTGPRRQACAKGCAGWRHFGHALQTNLYHELATIGLAALILYLTWGMPNQIGFWTFFVLWWMQLSAKLNVFLGVPNVSEEFLPEHLGFLKSFLNEKPMNLLFPVSVTVSVVCLTLLAQKALSAEATAFEAVGFTFLSTLVALAILEHWFLVLPLPAAALWNWSLAPRAEPQAPPIKAEPQVSDARGECLHATHRHDAAGHDTASPQRGPEKPFPRKRVTGVFAEASVPPPVTPSIARRQI